MKIESGLLFSACLLSLMRCYSCENQNYIFRCHSGDYEYLMDSSFCNGYDDCSDGEDERLGCIQGFGGCGRGKFSCDGQCKNINVRCNTIKDCQDITDELNCGDEINVKNCTSENKFLCKDGLRCLDTEYTCDDECNCFDCSDENSNCSKTDMALLKKCPHAYFRTPDGPQCFCGLNINNSSNSTLCSDIRKCIYEEKTWYAQSQCDQRCIQFKTKIQCSCYEGYHPINEILGNGCITTENFLILYAAEFEIKSINNTSHKTSTILYGIANCTLLTAANNYVYYATLSHDNRGSIFKAAINSSKVEKLIETNFPITSMAVDYITNNVYFTSNGSLSVCRTNGGICIQLKCCNVSSITLAPKSGWMFYMQMNTHQDPLCQNGFFLTRSNMDGSNETIRTNDCYTGEISIEMSESNNKLYLLRNCDNVKCKYSHSLFYEILIDSEFESPHYFSYFHLLARVTVDHFRVYNEELFFTIPKRNDIFYISSNISKHHSSYTFDPPQVYLHDNTSSAVSDLCVYNVAIQLSDENPCSQSSCSGLCLLKPALRSSKYFLNHSCLCDNFTNNRWCSNYSDRTVGMGTLITWIFGLLILLIAGAGYNMLKKRNWHGYYLTFRHEWQGQHDQTTIIVSDQE